MKRRLLALSISLGLLAAVLLGPERTSQLVPSAQCQDCQLVIRLCVDSSSAMYRLCMAIPGTTQQRCDDDRRALYDSCVRGGGCDPSSPPPIIITIPEVPVLPPITGIKRGIGKSPTEKA